MIPIDGQHLTSADIAALAALRDTCAVTPEAWERVARSRRFADRVSATRPVYGRSTGVGANRSIGIEDAGTHAHAHALLRSHAASGGRTRSAERVRAMLVVRLNQLAAGGSGASEAVLEGLAAMLAADALPQVRELGGIGTGDLTALATTALALMGEAPTSRPLPAFTEFGPNDALPFISSNAATIADAALACVRLRSLTRASVLVAALTFLAVRGNAEAFAEIVDRVTPFPGSRLVTRWMRTLIQGAPPAARIQDPFGLRTLPQTLGPALDALTSLDDVVARLANAPAENPVLWGHQDAETGELAHHGGFHAAYLASALDTAVITVAQSAKLVLARLTTLNDPDFTALPPFLGDGRAGSSGTMILEYVGASALGRLRAAATPAGLQSVVLSQGVEEDASFASLAAGQALDAVAQFRTLLGCELVAAVRALRLAGRVPADPTLRRALDLCADLPVDGADRDLSADIVAAEKLLPEFAELLD
ncbi:MAG TPA: aromatic amino acid lyase [Actinospica sp.]|jgi:histidine ammonia-lyase|nr:aromatic amino acid lyase [Actinospica sp.]